VVIANHARKIIHVDMDAFYASVEQRDNPEYRGKPLAVGSSPEQRGVVAAASYEARKFGIYSAMPSRIAITRCPHLLIVSPRFDVYRAISEQIHAIFERYTDCFEPVAFDEAYLDVTENKLGLLYASTVARHIRAAIFEETGLTASAGVSVNKFLAKMASGKNKPNGLTVILPEDAEAFVEALPVEKFHGIGEVTAAKMHELGIRTGSDLKVRSLPQLTQLFGKAGSYYCRTKIQEALQCHSFVAKVGQREFVHSYRQHIAQLLQAKLEVFGFALHTDFGTDYKEKYMEIMTSWEERKSEKIAINSLREGIAVEVVARITGLTVERVQELQAQMQSEQASSS